MQGNALHFWCVIKTCCFRGEIMDYIIKGHQFKDDVQSMTMAFLPNTGCNLVDVPSLEGLTVESVRKNDGIETIIYENAASVARLFYPCDDNVSEIKRAIKLGIREAFMSLKPVELPWGILTGVRPSKLVWMLWNEGKNDKEVYDYLSEKYLVSKEKLELMIEVARQEKAIIDATEKDSLALYCGIPFCPTKCLYCSFTSYSLLQYASKIDLYLEALEKEIEYASGKVGKRPIESLYIGGGTPTSLNEGQLERLLKMLTKHFDLAKVKEFTCEAGRPDTITKQKLEILKEYNVNRISINPQSLNNKTMEAIGRRHTVEDFFRAFELAREAGHNNINTDIILGLPDEGRNEVNNTLEGLKRLSPESITIHTLAIKRASRLRESLDSFEMTDYNEMTAMLNISYEYMKNMGLKPYYMYRQKNMLGNFENVGYAKEGYESIYNIQIMEENQDIIALGAGASTKLVDKESGRIERVFNVKSVDDYIGRIDEMIERKEVGIKWQ